MFSGDEDEWMPSWFRRKRSQFFRGSVFDEIEEQFREMHEYMRHEFQELANLTPEDLHQTRTLPDGSKVEEWGPFVYGYVMKVGPDGKPQIREFGNIKRKPQLGKATVDVKKEREPLVDVTIVGDEIKVTVELPGVDKQDIKLHGTEDELTISVDAGERSYYKEIELPRKVDVRKARSTYKNGVLEVTLPARREDEAKGQSISID